MAEFRHLIRIANTDLDGNKALAFALNKIRGVGIPLAFAICKVGHFKWHQKAGELSDDEMNKLNEIISDPAKFHIPRWMLNRRVDPETGEDRHIVTNDLIFIRGNDIKNQRRIKSYVGVRHSLGLPVRGQRTKSNFRPNKGKVTGVKTAGKKK